MIVATCQRLVRSPTFQRGITLAIVLAGVLVGLETSHTLMARHGELVRVLDAVVLVVFALEIVVRMTAEAPKPWRYFKDPWNTFDFVIVLGALLPFVAHYVTLLRLFRLLRVLRLVRAVPRLQLLVGALLHSLPSMGYVALLLGLLFYIYGVAGVFFFGEASPQYFGDLGTTFLTLFQIVTLEDWVDVLHQIDRGDGAPLAIAYLVSFILIGTMVMLNLVIGIVLEGMKEAAQSNATGRHEGGATDPPVAEVARLEQDLAALTQRLGQLRERLSRRDERIGR